MSKQIDALKLALEVLDLMVLPRGFQAQVRCKEAYEAIKEALAQPEQRSVSEHLEPVAWMDKDGERVVSAVQKAGMHKSLQASFPIALGYTTPPQRSSSATLRTWVGLTDEDKKEYTAQDFGGNRLDAMDWAEKRLKEKNHV